MLNYTSLRKVALIPEVPPTQASSDREARVNVKYLNFQGCISGLLESPLHSADHVTIKPLPKGELIN